MDSSTWLMNDQRFFKIIKRTDMPFVRFPPLFAEKNLDSPPHGVIVSTGDGKDWEMYISKDAQGLRLDAGWPAFREHYELKLEDVLVFLYDRNSHFMVSILDDSTRMERPLRLIGRMPGVASDHLIQTRANSSKRSVDELEFDNDDIQCSQRKLSDSARMKAYGKGVRTSPIDVSPISLSKKMSSPLRRYYERFSPAAGAGLFGTKTGESTSGIAAMTGIPGWGASDWASGIGRSGGVAFANINQMERRQAALSGKALRSRSMTPSDRELVIPLDDNNDNDPIVPNIVGPVHPAVPLNVGDEVPSVIILPDPCCYALAREDYIAKGLEIPYLWATEHFGTGENERVLVVDDPPSVTPIVCLLENGECRIVRGWVKFVLAHNIKEKDLMSFEVDPFDTNVWNTSIYKAKD